MKKLFLKTAIVLCSLSVALICLLLGYSFYVQANETKTWNKLSATVLSSTVIKEVRQKGITFCPKIRVSFNWAGVSYTSDLEISQEPCSIIEQNAERTASNLGAGKVLDVFVNPSKPSEVRLNTYSLGWVFYITVIGGLNMFMIAVRSLVSSAKSSTSLLQP